MSCSSSSAISITNGSPIKFLHVFPQGEHNIKSTPVARHGFQPHRSTHPCRCLAYDGKADAGSLELLLGMQPLEHPENLLMIAGIDADTVVAHIQLATALPSRLPAQFHPPAYIGPVELKGIADQVSKYLFKE